MGTRTITTFRSRWASQKDYTIHARIYRHWDGYPEHHGAFLQQFLLDRHVVNGKGVYMPEKWANGPGRLAGQFVAALHEDGHEPDLRDHAAGNCGQEFEYVVDVEDYDMGGGLVNIRVFDADLHNYDNPGVEPIFEGTAAEMGEWIPLVCP